MNRTGTCREPSCRASIVWLPTSTGKQMPCDAATVGPDDKIYDQRQHTSHFKTCKAPNRFSRGNRR